MTTLRTSRIIDAFENFQLHLALFYETFAELFPEDSLEWRNYAEDEIILTKRLAKLEHSLRNDIPLQEWNAMIRTINASTTFLQGKIRWLGKNDLGLGEAVLIAHKLENYILESIYPGIFNSGNTKVSGLGQMFHMVTADHLEKLAYWLESLENNAQLAA